MPRQKINAEFQYGTIPWKGESTNCWWVCCISECFHLWKWNNYFIPRDWHRSLLWICFTELPQSPSLYKDPQCLISWPRTLHTIVSASGACFKTEQGWQWAYGNRIPCCIAQGAHYFLVTVVKHHHQGNLQKKEFVLVYCSRGLRVHHGWQTCQQMASLAPGAESCLGAESWKPTSSNIST